MDVLGWVALVVSVALWLFNPQPVRRFLRLERAEPKPMYLPHRDTDRLRQIPELRDAIQEGDLAKLGWVLEAGQATMWAQGWRPFEVAGRRALYVDPVGTKVLILAWRPTK